MSQRYPVRQLAYFVPDIREAALAHHRLYGSGPFFVAEHIPLPLVHYRGREAELDHSSAYGQWGSVMVEFVQQNDTGPSAFRDLYPADSGRWGFHHVAHIVEDFDAARQQFTEAGFPEALYAEMSDGFPFVMHDASASLGHFIEIYPAESRLLAFYDMVADAAADYNGKEPLRDISIE